MATVIIPPGTANPVPLIADGDKVHLIEGEQDYSGTSLDLSALANGLNLLKFGKLCRVKNSASNPWKVDVDQGTNPHVLVAGGGPHYFHPGGGSSLITRFKMLAPGRAFFIGGGTVTNFEQRSGISDFSSAVIATNAYLGGGQCTIASNATAITLLEVGPGASAIIKRSITTGTFFGGNVACKADDSSGTLPTGGTIKNYGADVTWMFGAITSLELRGPNATFDISNAPKDFSIGTLIIDSWAKRNPKNKLVSQHAVITLPTPTVRFDETDDLSI